MKKSRSGNWLRNGPNYALAIGQPDSYQMVSVSRRGDCPQVLLNTVWEILISRIKDIHCLPNVVFCVSVWTKRSSPGQEL